jgi:hypothetical protein
MHNSIDGEDEEIDIPEILQVHFNIFGNLAIYFATFIL